MADDKKVTFAEEVEPAPGAGADVEEDEVRSLQARESGARGDNHTPREKCWKRNRF
jgi:hypothetical protein